VVYLDTSVIVAALTKEPRSEAVLAWIDTTAETLAISEWGMTEVSSALSIKVRSGKLTPSEQGSTLTAFNRLISESFELLPFAAPMFRAASRMADQHALRLRAGDALHLALCAHHHVPLCTLDGDQASAASALGIDAILL
jgi:predicted nucleic acid-binding protein